MGGGSLRGPRPHSALLDDARGSSAFRTTDAGGRFRVTGLDAGWYTLVLRVSEGVTEILEVELPGPGVVDLGDVEVARPRRCVVRGTVAGNDREGVALELLLGPDRDPSQRSAPWSTRAAPFPADRLLLLDSVATFRMEVDVPPEGTPALFVLWRGAASVRRPLFLEEGGDVELALVAPE